MKTFNEWLENQYYGIEEKMPYYVMIKDNGVHNVFRPYPFEHSTKLTLTNFGAHDTEIGKHLFDSWLNDVKSKGSKVYKIEQKDIADNPDHSWELKTHREKLEQM